MMLLFPVFSSAYSSSAYGIGLVLFHFHTKYGSVSENTTKFRDEYTVIKCT